MRKETYSGVGNASRDCFAPFIRGTAQNGVTEGLLFEDLQDADTTIEHVRAACCCYGTVSSYCGVSGSERSVSGGAG